MASGKTARRQLKFPKPTDAVTVSKDWEEFANQLDNDAETGQGTEAARPGASLRGKLYFVSGDGTAAKNNFLHWDTGSEWKPLQNLVAQGQTYGAQTSRSFETEYEPETIRSTLVIAQVNGVGRAGDAWAMCISFIVPPGKKWKCHKGTHTAEFTVGGIAVGNMEFQIENTGKAESLTTTYLSL